MAKRTTKKTPTAADQAARDAVAKLWEDFALGLEILKKCPKTTKSDGLGEERINDEARNHHLNPDTVRKLRQMVEEPNGYTKAEFRALCQLCLDHDYVLGRSHVFKFFTVPKGLKRVAFQTQAVKNGWTMARVRQELRRQFGHRRHGGRRPRLPINVPDALSQLDEMCLAWTRWYDLVEAGPVEGKKCIALEDLPEPVPDRLVQAAKMVRKLHTAVEVCLEQSRSAGRQGGKSRHRQKQGAFQAGKGRRRRSAARGQGLSEGPYLL